MPQENAELDRYADALVALGEASGTLFTLEEELSSLLDLFQKNMDIRRFLADGTVTAQGKTRALADLLEGKTSPVLLHFVLTLLAEGRIGELGRIAVIFFEKASGLRQKAAGELVSAVPLDNRQVSEIELEIGKTLGKDVHLRTRTDPSIIGGVRVQVSDFVLDYTVERRLEDIRRSLVD